MTYTKTFTVDVNAPTINITVIVDTVGIANVTVTNNAVPPVPIVGATVTLTGTTLSAITDINGLAVFNNVPQGTYSGIVTTT